MSCRIQFSSFVLLHQLKLGKPDFNRNNANNGENSIYFFVSIAKSSSIQFEEHKLSETISYINEKYNRVPLRNANLALFWIWLILACNHLVPVC